ncbi:MAG: ankyrin repeat domain-containing protein [Gammaproteobacteria bacterium]
MRCFPGIDFIDLSFSSQGFSRVFNLAGGWQAWKDFSETTSLNPDNNLKDWLEKNNFVMDNINSRVENGMTPLMLATLHDNEKLLEKILSCKPGINLVNNDGNNGLWFACMNNNTRLIKLLIDRGINVDNVNVNGATSLIYAASAGKYDAVRCLVKSGANLEIKTLDGFSALDSASTYKILKYLKPRYLNH